MLKLRPWLSRTPKKRIFKVKITRGQKELE
jgi:hypothetical protein